MNITKKIVHLVLDEKFIDMAFRQFEEVAPGQNIFVVLGDNRELKYIKKTPVHFMTNRRICMFLQTADCAALVLHSLNTSFSPFLKHIPKGKPVVWLGWGYDVYGSLLAKAFPDGLLLPQTRNLIAKKSPETLLNLAKQKAKVALKMLLWKDKTYSAEILNRVDYFIPVLDVEYELAIKLNPWFRPKYICWNYGTVEDDLSSGDFDADRLGEDILVGNSATPENNHLEVFELIKNSINVDGKRIIVPLSYGDAKYRDEIITIGKSYFCDQFVPLVDFMPKDQYISLLNSCGFVFFNHLRQQAMGNIIITLMKGAKIFMNSRSPAYKWLIDKGATVFPCDKPFKDSAVYLTKLDDLTRQKNIDVVLAHWGRAPQKEKTRKLVEIALGLHQNESANA